MSLDDTLLPDSSLPKRVLITGANGQVGWELQRTVPDNTDIIALDSSVLDIRDQAQVKKIINETSPDVVINAAAYTAVDKAEQEPEFAYAVNAKGAGYLARASNDCGARFIQISTDFVFDGTQTKPYLPDDLPNPLGVYGASKLEGEQIVAERTQGQALILRTSWVYSSHGNNFVKTMLRLMHEREELGVVVDQVGAPTWANNLARVIWFFVTRPPVKGIFHYTDSGVASWYDFAVAIQDEALRLGLLNKQILVNPVAAAEYPLPAKRPVFSVLDKSETWQLQGERSPHWRHSLTQMLRELKTV